MSNRLQYESSPYLRQHAENPVDWYPWSEEAFARAREENKPIFLSIGYSTCHWCHVMAHESFESPQVAELLNRCFISIKVDREERPDIDSIYMRVCQAFTGSGGWPMSIFMTPDQKPFFAGTYFPVRRRRGMIGFTELLTVLHRRWEEDQEALLERADEIVSRISGSVPDFDSSDEHLIEQAVSQYERSFDRVNGGFGGAPKFPAPHNLLFLMENYRRTGKQECRDMVFRTLLQMYRGGLFDHVGGGFSRYSTDAKWFAPHFEKMLYDNALLIMVYCRAHAIAGDSIESQLFLKIAVRTAEYVLREMTSPEGGFYSAQDADSEGREGKYYLFSKEELRRIIPAEDFEIFCRRFGVTEQGNFEGENILNLLSGAPCDDQFDRYFEPLYQYRKRRYALHLDDKILTSWNGLMIAALCDLYLETGSARWLEAAKSAERFIRERLMAGGMLYSGISSDRLGVRAFLDDYAAFCYAQLALQRATLDDGYLDLAQYLCQHVLERFNDSAGGFFLSANDGESLIFRPKETYDGAMPSGNSMMAVNLVRLWQLTGEEKYQEQARKQLEFMAAEATAYPMGYGMLLCAWQEYQEPSVKAVVVVPENADVDSIVHVFPAHAVLRVQKPSEEYPALEGKITYYICEGMTCRPPVTDIDWPQSRGSM